MEAGEYGLTRGTWVFARRLEAVAVAGLLWIQWCVLGGADFFPCSFHEFVFSNSYIQIGEGAPTASQSAHREPAPTYPQPGVPFSVLPPEKFGVSSSSVQ